MMLVAAAVAIAATMALALTRALLGPSVFDRVLAMNMFGTKTVLFLAVTSFAMGRPDFIDMSLTYALINFIGVIAVLEFSYSQEAGPRRRAAQQAAAAKASGLEVPGVVDEGDR